MIEATDFSATMALLGELLPYGKALSAEAVAMMWITFPARAKAELGIEHLRYAVSQRLLDPNPRREDAPHIGLLRYLYRERDGAVSVADGLKPGLVERMEQPEVFHQGETHQAGQVFRAADGGRLLAGEAGEGAGVLSTLGAIGTGRRMVNRDLGGTLAGVLARSVRGAERWRSTRPQWLEVLRRDPADLAGALKAGDAGPWVARAVAWAQREPEAWAAMVKAAGVEGMGESGPSESGCAPAMAVVEAVSPVEVVTAGGNGWSRFEASSDEGGEAWWQK